MSVYKVFGMKLWEYEANRSNEFNNIENEMLVGCLVCVRAIGWKKWKRVVKKRTSAHIIRACIWERWKETKRKSQWEENKNGKKKKITAAKICKLISKSAF